MKRIAKSLVAAAVAALLPGIAGADGKDYMLLAHPKAVDGRTFTDDHGNLYRLHAIDAPDIEQSCLSADGKEYACGKEARDALDRMIDGILTCDPVNAGATDTRPVRCQDFAGRDIAARLIAAGWAVPDRSLGLDYVWDEMEAEARALGLWQGRFIAPARWRSGSRL